MSANMQHFRKKKQQNGAHNWKSPIAQSALQKYSTLFILSCHICKHQCNFLEFYVINQQEIMKKCEVEGEMTHFHISKNHKVLHTLERMNFNISTLHGDIGKDSHQLKDYPKIGGSAAENSPGWILVSRHFPMKTVWRRASPSVCLPLKPLKCFQYHKSIRQC